MSTVEITRVEDVRVGDVVVVARGDATATGRVHDVSRGPNVHLTVAYLPFTVIVGEDHWTFVRATREGPDLPTEPGSVIVNATIRGVEGQTAIRDPEGDWFTTTCVEDYYYHAPEHITAWEPARVVPEGGAS